jgi:hypothetical protein
VTGGWWGAPQGVADPLDMIIRETLTKALPAIVDPDEIVTAAKAVRGEVEKAGYVRTSVERLFWEQPDFWHEPHPQPVKSKTFEVDGVVSRTV